MQKVPYFKVILVFGFYCLTAAGTTHRVNGIVIQPGKFAEIIYSDIKKERSRRSFQIHNLDHGEEYLEKKRIGPEQLSCTENEEKCLMIANQERMHLSWILSHKAYLSHKA